MSTGKLVIISSPSGGGKDSIINALLKILPNSGRLLTTTTRPLRPGNIQGVDYNFVSQEEFLEKIKSNDFLEYNNYAGNYYGSEKEKLTQALENYNYVLTQIEVNGKHNLDKIGIKNISVFLLPDNLDILAERIRKRGGISEGVLKERLEIAKKEIDDSVDYNLRIVNKDGYFEETVQKIAEFLLKQA